MRNQFIYTEEITIPAVAEELEKGIKGEDSYVQKKENSFNIEMVIRTISLDNGGLLVLLDDLHERAEEMQKVNRKTGKVSVVRERNTFQSEIRLSSKDGKRFLKLTNIETK